MLGWNLPTVLNLIIVVTFLTMEKVTYVAFACDSRPLKDEKWRIQLVVGGDRLDFNFDTGSPATDLTEWKILLNSVISDASDGARFVSIDLKDMFLHTIMKDPEFMKVPYKYFPEDIRKRYQLNEKVDNNFIYVRINKGMHGLKQAALLAYQTSTQLLTTAGYEPILSSMGI